MSELIDRQETIKEFCKQDCDCDPKDCPNKTCYEVEIIESVPSVQPQWIPVSERLPGQSGRYLISVLDGRNVKRTIAPYHPRMKSWTLTGRMAYWKVIAWMPLPEPYKEGSDEVN